MSERRRVGASREAFVRATGQLLRRQGYGATGLNEIVTASGAPKGSLYFHFPGGKEGLAVAAMTREAQMLRDAIAALLRSREDVVDAVARVIDALEVGLERSDFQDGCPLATVALEQSTRSEAVRDAAAGGFNSWLEQIEQRLLDAGFADSVAHRKAFLVLSAIEGALILARARRDVAPLAAVREELSSILS